MSATKKVTPSKSEQKAKNELIQEDSLRLKCRVERLPAHFYSEEEIGIGCFHAYRRPGAE